ncbi:hypothetical protein GCM10025864_28600 [Luteimicrobium album]|uniref:Glycosyltransferase 2-like domain-containing protein n=1 Tax=Luteimicrobium album TaxID=1054550 RepID=A0ABQ6I351_9MICO|nr:hypothetical protein GCM10025864_28600 [Luteimicrobium album]
MKPSSVTHTLRSVATRAPRKAQAELRALRRRRHLVSVVVPVYNVEKYVAECLDSILAQTHPRLEVLVVDDGSPDSSIAIVESIARRDKRVRIIHQANGGLGAARNTGARHARGEFLWFVDSDDVVPPRAVEVMLESLLESGSDFAVGSLVRWDSTGTHTPPWAKRVHAKTLQGRSVSDDVEILKDVFAWNKLFRREFFLRVVKEYPAGVYEDQVPSAKAYLGGKFDVLSEVVYHWRVRDDTSSITQQKATIEDLSGRWAVIDALHDAMAQAPEDVRRSWQAKVIGFDMRLYYEQIPRTDETYWDFLSGRVRGFLDDAGYDVIRDVLVADRPFVSAVYQGHRDDIARLVVRRETQTWKVPGVVQDGRPVLAPEFFDGLDLEPDEVVSDLSVDVEVVSHTDDVVIDESAVRVTGSAYLSFIDLARADHSEIAVTAVSSGATRSSSSWSDTTTPRRSDARGTRGTSTSRPGSARPSRSVSSTRRTPTGSSCRSRSTDWSARRRSRSPTREAKAGCPRSARSPSTGAGASSARRLRRTSPSAGSRRPVSRCSAPGCRAVRSSSSSRRCLRPARRSGRPRACWPRRARSRRATAVRSCGSTSRSALACPGACGPGRSRRHAAV